MLRVGQKVVCVDDGPNAQGMIPNVRAGEVFTIAAIYPEMRYGTYGVELVERAALGPLKAFRASRFRPVVESKTDISIFTAILNGQRVPERQCS